MPKRNKKVKESRLKYFDRIVQSAIDQAKEILKVPDAESVYISLELGKLEHSFIKHELNCWKAHYEDRKENFK